MFVCQGIWCRQLVCTILLRSNDPAIIIECLNGYRLKEKLPSNLAEMTVLLVFRKLLKKATDITIVSYGSTLRIVQDAVSSLEAFGISCEIIDVQTLLPFDINHRFLIRLKKQTALFL